MKILDKIKSHIKIIKYIFILLLVFASFFALKSEMQKINMDSLNEITSKIKTSQIVITLVLGIISFSFSTLYDMLLSKFFKLPIKKTEVFKMSWVCQSFNYFIGIAGLTGSALRYNLYKKAGIDESQTIKLTIAIAIYGIFGLCFLALPAALGILSLKIYLWLIPMIAMFIVALVLIFIDYIPIKYFQSDKSPATFLDKKSRYLLALSSILEWIIASLFFYICLKTFKLEISVFECIAVYITSIIIGLLSMIPGGIGSFDAAVIFILGKLGYDSENIVLSLILFRIGYYILPWIIGVLILSFMKLKDIKHKTAKSFKARNKVFLIMGWLVLISGIILILSASTPAVLQRSIIIRKLFPKLVPIFSSWISFCMGLALVILSKGIFDGVKRAHFLTVIFLMIASFLCILKGLDYEEAILMIFIAIALVIFQDSFQYPSQVLTKKTTMISLILTITITFLYFIIYNTTHNVDFINGTHRYSLNYLRTHGLGMMGILAVNILLTLTFLFTNKKYRQFEEVSAEDIQYYEMIKLKYENSSYTHLFYMNDKDIFINKEKTVMFLYRPYKENIFVLGDPVGNPEDIEDAIDELILWAHNQDMKVTFYEITGKYIEDFVNNGLKFLKLGETAKIEFETFSLEGKKGKAFRHTLNQFGELGYVFENIKPPFSTELMSELENISIKWLNKREEMSFSVGAFKESYIQSSQLFVVKNKEGNIVAFANQLPIINTTILSIDLMRYLPNEQAGIIDFLFLSLIQWGKNNGYTSFDIGVAPLSNVGNKLYSSNKEKLMRLAFEYGNIVYGFEGLRNFKEKFQPQWQNVYIAYKDDKLLPGILMDLIKTIHSTEENSEVRKR